MIKIFKDSVNCSRLFLEILQKETDEKKKDELLEAFVYQLVFNIERPRRDAQDYETGFWRRLLQKYGDKYPNILQAVKEYEEYIQSLDGAEDFRTFWTQYGDERYENIYAKMLQFEEKDYGTGKDR